MLRLRKVAGGAGGKFVRMVRQFAAGFDSFSPRRYNVCGGVGMKLFHLSDLHLGKRVYECSFLEDQAYILEQILSLAAREKPDALLIAGDVYDKSAPSAEAVALLDDFLARLSQMGQKTFVISGNHDSAERVAFAGRLVRASGIYLSPVYAGTVAPITLEDAFGAVDFFLLPFLKPASVRRFYPEEDIPTTSAAIACAIAHMPIDPSRRNVLLAHQFVAGGQLCDAEEFAVGDADNVSPEAFAPFDYVALGHLHGAQNAQGERVRYCGSPLKYSFSEARQQKSLTVVELGEKGALRVSTRPLTPRRDLCEIRGTLEEVTSRAFYESVDAQAYMHVVLTNEEDAPGALARLRAVYPNLLRVSRDNRAARSLGQLPAMEEAAAQSPLELFAAFYERRNGAPLSGAQKDILQKLIADIWEGEGCGQ